MTLCEAATEFFSEDVELPEVENHRERRLPSLLIIWSDCVKHRSQA